MQFSLVEPTDLDAVRPFRSVLARAQGYERPWAVVWQPEELLEILRDRSGNTQVEAYVGSLGGEPVVAGWVRMPLRDNLSVAEVELGTVPEARRAGHGTAMLDHLEAVAREHDRTVLQANLALAPAGTQDVEATSTNLAFARAHGWRIGQREAMRQLDLPVSEERLDAFAAEAAGAHAGYRIEVFTRPVPDRLLASFAALQALLMTEAPTGEMTREPESPDPAAVRGLDDLLAAQGRTSFVAVALNDQEDVVAYSELVTGIYEPDRAYQWGTLVAREHRGHRLGVAVKVAALRALQEQAPKVERIRTWNADSNAHMVGINEQLGWRVVEHAAEIEKVLD